MQDDKWASINLNGTADDDNKMEFSGCAVVGISNLLSSVGVKNSTPDNVNKVFVNKGKLNWQAVGDYFGMNVKYTKGTKFTVELFKDQHNDSENGYLTLVNVNYDDKGHDHWVGVNGVAQIDGKDYVIISNTSKNDNAVGSENLRGKQGWIEENGVILVPVDETKGYVNFSAPILYE